MGLFGTSGVRGRYPSQVNEELMLQLGQALSPLYDEAVVGRDVRLSGPSLQSALMAGLTSGGSQVYDCGVVSTPTVAHAASFFDFGGVLTASHNPPEYNGLKLWTPSGMAFDESLRSQVEEALGTPPRYTAWREVGDIHPHEGALQEHRSKVLAAVGSSEVKVAVDCGNGATSLLTPWVLRELGCDVLTLNAQPDGTFPGRGAEPKEKALDGLRRAVRRRGCTLGIAHDGDGDRMVAVDQEGRTALPEHLLILFAKTLGANKVVVPADASMVLEDVLGEEKVVRTRVGDVYVAEALVAQGGDLGGEASGTWIFPRFSLCPDGIYAAAYLCTLLDDSPLSGLTSEMPEYPLIRGSVGYEGELPADSLESAIMAEKPEEVSRQDGWRLTFEDGWALVRPSGTEPTIRLTAEAREESRAREIYASLLSRVSKAIR